MLSDYYDHDKFESQGCSNVARVYLLPFSSKLLIRKNWLLEACRSRKQNMLSDHFAHDQFQFYALNNVTRVFHLSTRKLDNAAFDRKICYSRSAPSSPAERLQSMISEFLTTINFNSPTLITSHKSVVLFNSKIKVCAEKSQVCFPTF